MESFEELGISSPLVESLASEGIEQPTALQVEAIPVLRRGHSAVLRGGPGAGLLVAYGVPLLDHLSAEGDRPSGLILTSERSRADELALSLARIAVATDHRIGALGGPWAFPERASILFSSPIDLEQAIRTSQVKLDRVGAIVLDGASSLLAGPDAERLEGLLSAVGAGNLQIAVVSDPLTPEVRRFADRHLRRAVYIPTESASERDEDEVGIERGVLRVRTSDGDRVAGMVALVAELLNAGTAHVLLFVRSPDRAADLGDILTLHGYHAGPPGDPDVPVWLGVDPLEAREEMAPVASSTGTVAVLSVDVPTDPDDLDRRHGGSPGGGYVLAHPREMPHLRRTARVAGYRLEPLPSPVSSRDRAAAEFFRQIDHIIETEDLLPQLLFLEPALRRWGAPELAAALALLLRRKAAPAPTTPAVGTPREEVEKDGPGPRPQAWVRIFLSVGERDGIGAGDLLGAIIGESGVAGDQVGRIDLRDTYSKVEVHQEIAEKVIRALNGTSIRGRSVRADFDRGDTRPRPGPGPRAAGGGQGTSGTVRRGGGRGPRPEGGGPPRS